MLTIEFDEGFNQFAVIDIATNKKYGYFDTEIEAMNRINSLLFPVIEKSNN
jgi:hypothetical protein